MATRQKTTDFERNILPVFHRTTKVTSAYLPDGTRPLEVRGAVLGDQTPLYIPDLGFSFHKS